jgi:DNA invertase Pin-like site-specific DNA recombinase
MLSVVYYATAPLTAHSKRIKLIPMKTAYSYRRFSSKKQATGTSLERQLEMAKEICQEKKWNLQDLPPDAGISGFKGANFHKGALGIFLQKVLNKEIPIPCVLILEKMDRFSRNEVDIVIPLFLSLLQNGVEIFTCSDQAHYTLEDIRANPMLLQLAIMGMAMASDFSKSLSKRILKTWAVQKAEALKGKAINFGNWQPRWITFSKDGFSLNEKAKVVRGIVDDYLSGKSMMKIAKELNEAKVPCIGVEGKHWTQGSIHYLLHTENLLGNISIKDFKKAKYYPAVISDEQWNLLQAKLSQNIDNHGGSREGDTIPNLFRNRTFCASCGGSIGVCKSMKHRKYPYYYKCHKARRGTCNVRTMIPIKPVEDTIFGFILDKHPSQITENKSPELKQKIAKLQMEISTLDASISDASELIGTMPLQTIKAKLTSFVTQKETAQNALDELNRSFRSIGSMPEAFKSFKELLCKVPTAGEEYDKMMKDQTLRSKLLSVLPSIVTRLEIDLKNYKTRIVTHSGASDWYDIAY